MSEVSHIPLVHNDYTNINVPLVAFVGFVHANFDIHPPFIVKDILGLVGLRDHVSVGLTVGVNLLHEGVGKWLNAMAYVSIWSVI